MSKNLKAESEENATKDLSELPSLSRIISNDDDCPQYGVQPEEHARDPTNRLLQTRYNLRFIPSKRLPARRIASVTPLSSDCIICAMVAILALGVLSGMTKVRVPQHLPRANKAQSSGSTMGITRSVCWSPNAISSLLALLMTCAPVRNTPLSSIQIANLRPNSSPLQEMDFPRCAILARSGLGEGIVGDVLLERLMAGFVQ